MAIQPTRPQSIGGVLDTSFQVYKASAGSVWPICLLIVLGSIPALFLTLKVSSTATPADPMAVLAIFSDPKYWLSNLLTMVVSALASGAMYVKQQAVARGEELSLGGAFQTSLSRLLSQVVALILYMVAVTIGFILLVVPGFILMLSLMLCWVVIVLEGKGPIAGLTGSHRLVWGNWWRVTAILTVGFFILIILYMAIGFLVGIIVPFVGFGDDPFMAGLVGGIAINGILSVLVMPYYAALLLSIYWDLKLRKEGGDLAARVGALSAA